MPTSTIDTGFKAAIMGFSGQEGYIDVKMNEFNTSKLVDFSDSNIQSLSGHDLEIAELTKMLTNDIGMTKIEKVMFGEKDFKG